MAAIEGLLTGGLHGAAMGLVPPAVGYGAKKLAAALEERAANPLPAIEAP
jgi:hypothetical protein